MQPSPDEAGARRLLGRASIVAAGQIYQKAISFISGLIIARVIGASDFGIFNLARNLIDLTAIVTRLGLGIGLQRYFGESAAARDRPTRIAVLRRLRLLADAFAILVAVAVGLGLGKVLEENVYPFPGFGAILLCLAIALPFATDIAILDGAYMGILKPSPAVIAENVLSPTIRLAVIVILFVAGWRLWAVVVGTTLASVLASVFLAMRAHTDFPHGAHAPKPWVDAFRVVRYSSVLAGTALVATLTNTMDTLMLGHFTTSEDVGQYSLVKMLLTLMVLLGGAFTTGLGSLVAERYTRGDLDAMIKVMCLTTRYITLTTLPIFVMFLFWGMHLTLVFGPTFASSQSVVSWLAVSQFGFLILGHAGWALSMTGRHFLELKILFLGLIVATVLCWFVVPIFGQLGAAVAVCGSVITTNLTRILFVRRFAGAFPLGSDIIVITAVGVGLGWASSFAVGQFSLSPVWSAIVGIGCFVLAFALASWTYLLSNSEKRGIRGMARRTVQMLF